jgi:hypothetical protein
LLDISYNKSKTISNFSNKSTGDININLLPKATLFNRKYYELEEWWLEALKLSNMDINDFKKLKSNKAFAKIVDLIENLNNVVLDKNFQISLIEKENGMLNEKIETVNKENINLYQQLKDIVNTKDDSSMHNNLSNNVDALNKSQGLGLLKQYEPTMETVNSCDLNNEFVNMNYFTVESVVDKISIN